MRHAGFTVNEANSSNESCGPVAIRRVTDADPYRVDGEGRIPVANLFQLRASV
jgi:hypothetical protein